MSEQNKQEMELEIDYSIEDESETEVVLDNDTQFSDDEVVYDEHPTTVSFEEDNQEDEDDVEISHEKNNDVKKSASAKEPMAQSQKIFLAGAGVVSLGLLGFLGWTFLGGNPTNHAPSQSSVSQFAPVAQKETPSLVVSQTTNTTSSQVKAIEPVDTHSATVSAPQQVENHVTKTTSVSDSSSSANIDDVLNGSKMSGDNSSPVEASENKVMASGEILTKLDAIEKITAKSNKENTHLNKAQVLALSEILNISKEIKSSLDNENRNKELITPEDLKSLKDKLSNALSAEEELKSENALLSNNVDSLKADLENYKEMLSKTFEKIRILKAGSSRSSNSSQKVAKTSINKNLALKGMSYKVAIFEDKKGNTYQKTVGDSIGGEVITEILPEDGIVKTKTSQFKIN